MPANQIAKAKLLQEGQPARTTREIAYGAKKGKARQAGNGRKAGGGRTPKHQELEKEIESEMNADGC